LILTAKNQADFYNRAFELYNKKYDSDYVKMVTLIELTNGLKMLNCESFGKVLEMGCGIGINYNFLEKFCNSYTGIDISEKQIEEAKKRNKNKNHVNFYVEDVHKTSFNFHSFNTVIAFGCLHHLMSPKDAVKEAYRLLKNGGEFIAYEPSKHNIVLNIIRNVFKKFHPAFHKDEISFFKNDLVSQFKEAGFKNVKVIFQIYLLGFFSLYNIKNKLFFNLLFKFSKRFDAFICYNDHIPKWVKKQAFSLVVVGTK